MGYDLRDFAHQRDRNLKERNGAGMRWIKPS
jgi:hypothetical protein